MWLPLTLFSALVNSAQAAYYKKTATHIHPFVMMWSVLSVSSIFFLPLFSFGIPPLDRTFWIAVFVRIFFDTIAFSLYIQGVQKAPLILTAPMMAIGPVFSIVFGFLLTGLIPSPLGFLGIFLSVAGVYTLNFDYDRGSLFSPFAVVLRNRGVLYVTIAALIWSALSSLRRIGIDHSSVMFYTATTQVLWAILFTPVAILADRRGFFSLLRSKKGLLLVPGGVLDGVKMIALNSANSLTVPAFVDSANNTGIIFSSAIGVFYFKEHARQRILPIVMIILGLTTMVLSTV